MKTALTSGELFESQFLSSRTGVARPAARGRRAIVALGAAAFVGLAASGWSVTFTVTTVNDSGAGSLRQALATANSTAGPDRIVFAIPGGGPKTISLLSELPAISDTAIIDGTTQPGYAGTPLIELNGRNAGSEAFALVITTDACRVSGLCINRFARDGIRIEHGSGNLIQANFIGTDVTGRLALGNGDGAVTISDASDNVIGGTLSSSRNLLSGGNRAGVFILGAVSRGNRVEGNWIGVDITGAQALGNTNGGVVVIDAPANIIGGVASGAGNVISGNGQSGVIIQGKFSIDNRIEGNFIGLDSTGRLNVGNAFDGVSVDGAIATRIGGEQLGARNIISANGNRGIDVRGSGAVGTLVQGNFIGTDATGARSVGNAFSGLRLGSVAAHQIGGTNAGARNVISGNGESGVYIEGRLASNNVVQGNIIGLDVSGSRPLSNGLNGVFIVSGGFNLVGGSVPGAGNVISANGLNGVFILDPGANDNRVQGNFIGTDITGAVGLGNQWAGVRIETTRNVVGGTRPSERNVISGNFQSGVLITEPSASNNIVMGNLIGTDARGVNAIGNTIAGVGLLEAPRNQIGGAEPGARNVISGNIESGIYVRGAAADDNVVRGNYIGTDITGTLAVPNNIGGVYMYGATRTIIGGTAPGAGNLISGNLKIGISIGDPGANATIIQGNFIGTQANGYSPLGNEWHNIEILNTSSNNVIGGVAPGAGNRIAFCRTPLYAGVRVRDGCNGNSIRGNAIFLNSGLGIDLGVNGVSANDSCDADGGANTLQNFPLITAANGQFISRLQGRLNSRKTVDYTVDFYSAPTQPPFDGEEGVLWLGARTVRTDDLCAGNFNVLLTNSFPAAGRITATATDPGGNTSEFAADVALTPGGDQDGDGMPDDFETAFGLNPALNDAAGDADGDGATNQREFTAGTLPNSAASRPRILLLGIDAAGVHLGIESVRGKRYDIESTDRLPGPWSVLVANLAGTGSLLRITDRPTVPQRFYRFRVGPL